MAGADSGIELRSFDGSSEFHDPRRGFAPFAERFQLRFDPLTGRSGRIAHIGIIKPQKLSLEKYAEPPVRGYCPFCVDPIEKVTPRYPEHILPGGRLAVGEALLVPNLYPYDEFSAVTILSRDHVVPLPEMSRERVRDGLEAGLEFLRRIATVRPDLGYRIIAWNYMPPSGGGLIHPHQQVLATRHPGNLFLDECTAALAFHARHGEDFWTRLVAQEEKTGARHVGAVGAGRWYTPFVSLGLLGEVDAVFPGVRGVEEFGGAQLDALVDGIARVLAYFVKGNICSFNAALFLGPPGQEALPVRFRIMPRTFLNSRDNAPDMNFFQAMMQEPVSVVFPEDLCSALRPYFVE